MLTVAAKDFGPIIEGTVELRPLTVFVGPSNTGKSYLATLVYALMEGMAGGMIPPYNRHRFPADADYWRVSHPIWSAPPLEDERAGELKSIIAYWVGRLAVGGWEPYVVPFNELPVEIQTYTRETIDSSLQSAAGRFDRNLQRIHGKVSDLRRRNSSSAQLRITFEQGHPLLKAVIGESDGTGQISLLSHVSDISGAEVKLHPSLIEELRDAIVGRNPPEPFPGAEIISFLMQVGSGTLQSLFQHFPGSRYYLPDARSGVIQGQREIASALVRQSDASNLPGIITDFISTMLLVRKRGLEEIDPELQGATDFLEQQVIRGKVNLEESELPYPEIYYETDAGKFLLRQTSSMVSELAPLILFLKYLVRPGDLLILEEPESHLHPASQRRMAQGIVRLVNAGVRVLITTHSDYFVGQLNNLLRISYASDRWLKREGFARADCLKHSDVGAYAFLWDEDAEGSRVKELPIAPDFGIEDTGFLEAAEALYEETISAQRIRVK